MAFDPRTLATPVYESLNQLCQSPQTNETRLKEQKKQAVELYTYLSTWGLLRLKAEEFALSKEGHKEIVRVFFDCLETLSTVASLSGSQGLVTLKNLTAEEYLGLSGLGLALAQEFSFWATAVYVGIEVDD
ncbi:MAG: hypothetical protein HC924_18530 [Synechococcaceae cyanobacterium SM2_3_2]|nr:hypothetical protein [Synechococcaceae cyanobacterium SM2_3_2]